MKIKIKLLTTPPIIEATIAFSEGIIALVPGWVRFEGYSNSTRIFM